MSSDRTEPTEASSLLPAQATTGSLPTSAETAYNSISRSSDVPEEDVEDAAEEDSRLTRQVSTDDRNKQYQGVPELKERMKYMFPALTLGVFMAAADQTLIVSSSGKIGTELNALNKTSWIATAYFLTLTSFQPLYGKLSDIFSRKSCLLFAYTVFGLGCLMCGLAQDINQLVIARAIAGIGGGGMTTVVSILLSDVIPLKERGKWQGFINIVFASGAGTGAPLGGFMADTIGWRWSFLIQAPLCLVAFILVAAFLKLPVKDNSHWKSKLGRVDFLGATCLIAAVFALLFGLDRGSNDSWTSKWAIVPLSVSIPLFALFILIEVKVAAEPFAPGHIIFHRSLFACYLCNFFSFAGYMGAYFYIPLYYQAYAKHSATKAGLLLLPNITAGVSGSLFAGFYMQRFGRFYWLTVFAYGLLTVGMTIILMCSGVLINSDTGIALAGVLCGFGNGIGVTSALIGLISNSKRDDQAVATACSYLFRSLGSTVGVSLSSSVANQALRALLSKELSGNNADKIVEEIRKNLDYLYTLKPAVQAIARHCYMVSIDYAFLLQTLIVSGAFFSAFFIREKPLS